MHEAPRLFVIGPGRAGLGIAHAALAAGLEVVGVQGLRPRDLGPPFGTVFVPRGPGDRPPALAHATIVFVAVQDRALGPALAALAAMPVPHGAVVLHASGSAAPEVLAPVRAAGVSGGTFHPLVPLADHARAPALMRGAWVGVDGDARAVLAAHALAARLGAHVLDLPAGDRARYHAAAVVASNFPVVLAATAERLLIEAGVDRDAARPAVRHLLASAAANLAADGEAADALTGPIARGDAATVARHLGALTGDPGAAALYRALARATLDLASASATPPSDAARDAIAQLLA